ncbi:DUF6371 domain-containing protein [Siphonobacter sp. SORGH_AS_0500]|uniref:DUF6371 domain-containing protein n=1 Tax=Siphonobacter sp. SORGH_AS_0500 TaxID=1864824 RepID=UPI00285FB8EF|nr:DUF6371 domain-containing protein [Siphonobacter sp. SORGH_AS_0500]MDR6194934.1 hypothetical protein [Siphonobacter sp. SORGH_AS_0500]
MKDFQYALDKSSKKFDCPECGKRRMVRYVDLVSGDYLPHEYGRCDREAACNYHLNPYADGFGKDDTVKSKPVYTYKKPEARPLTFYPPEIVGQLYNRNISKNQFLDNLLHNIPYPFAREDVDNVREMYQLGTVEKGYMAGAVAFPYIDEAGNTRTIQIKTFDKGNHTEATNFLHSYLEKNLIELKKPVPEWIDRYKQNELRVSCLFGAHLLPKYPFNPVAIVEAPKTAILGTLYNGFPAQDSNLLWLAVYNLTSLSYEKIKVLEGRTVILFPDLSQPAEGKLSAYEKWQRKVEEFSPRMPGTRFVVSDILETSASQEQRIKGLDVADFFTKMDWRTFRAAPDPVEPFEIPQIPQPLIEEFEYPESWNETSGPEMKTAPFTRSYEQELFDSLLSELDRGAHFKQLQQRQAYRSLTDTSEDLQAYFHKLSREYLPQLTKVQKMEFIRQRQQAGFTLLGIVEDFPGLGFRNEKALHQFLQGG